MEAKPLDQWKLITDKKCALGEKDIDVWSVSLMHMFEFGEEELRFCRFEGIFPFTW